MSRRATQAGQHRPGLRGTGAFVHGILRCCLWVMRKRSCRCFAYYDIHLAICDRRIDDRLETWIMVVLAFRIAQTITLLKNAVRFTNHPFARR